MNRPALPFADAFTTLGKQRTEAILRALKEAGVAEASAVADAANEAIDSGTGELGPIKLGSRRSKRRTGKEGTEAEYSTSGGKRGLSQITFLEAG